MENNTSVSGNEIVEEEVTEDVQEEIPDALPDEEIVEENNSEIVEDVLPEQNDEPSEDIGDDSEYVESSDVIEESGETVSGSDVLESLEDFGYPSIMSDGVAYTVYEPDTAAFWDKPLSEYTVVDGILLTALTIAAFVFLWAIVK